MISSNCMMFNQSKRLTGTGLMASRYVVIAAASLCLSLGSANAQNYSESPSLAAQVSSGALPPVEERLPVNPAVMEPLESIGDYSENIYVFTADNTPWNTLQ